MGTFKKKVVLIVNVASKCGLTPQYQGLEKIYQRFKSDGLEVLAFPCNQFGGQEPGSDSEIKKFCSLNYPVSFQIFSKIDVNGPNALPLYKFLQRVKTDFHLSKSQLTPFDDENEPIKWNFTKFVIDRHGQLLTRFSPQTPPEEMAPYLAGLIT